MEGEGLDDYFQLADDEGLHSAEAPGAIDGLLLRAGVMSGPMVEAVALRVPELMGQERGMYIAVAPLRLSQHLSTRVDMDELWLDETAEVNRWVADDKGVIYVHPKGVRNVCEGRMTW